MASTTVTISDQSFNIGEVAAGVAKAIRRKVELQDADFGAEWLAASLQAAGDQTMTLDAVNELPYTRVYGPLLHEVLKFNGLVPAGEAQAAPAPVAA